MIINLGTLLSAAILDQVSTGSPTITPLAPPCARCPLSPQ